MNQGTPSMVEAQPPRERTIGRYVLFDEIASGGMATVHLGRMLGPAGFNKTVAIKRLHGNLARDPEFVSMFLDEARLAARIQHPNVVATLDVVPTEGEVFLVLDYVQGESLSHLLKAARIRNETVAPRIMASIMVNVLHGLHAAHEAVDEHGQPLGIVHRDVSPQNVLVGSDGVARVLDFGVAKAAGRMQQTRDGQLKGKIAYMAPEQIRGEPPVDRRTDVYAAAVVLWEGLAGRRLVHGMNEGQVLAAVLGGSFAPPSSLNPAAAPLDSVVMKALAQDPTQRFGTAREMAIAVERAVGVASSFEVAEWVQSVGAEALAMRAARVREMESTSAVRVTLHDETAPVIWHAGGTDPAYDRSRSGISSVGVRPDLAVPSVPPPLPASHNVYTPTAPPTYARSPYGQPPVAFAPAQPASRTRLVVLSVIASGMLGLLLIGLVLLLRGKPAAPPAAATAEAAAAAAQPAAPAPAPTPEPAPTAEPLPTAESENVVDVPPVAMESEPSAAAQPEPKPEPNEASKPAPVKPPPTQRTPAKCDPPFYVDSAGIKHIKPECM